MELIFLSKKGKKKVAIDLNGNEIRDIGEIFQVSETYKKYNTYFIITPEKLFAYNYKHKKLKLLAYHKIDLELLDCFLLKFYLKPTGISPGSDVVMSLNFLMGMAIQ